MTIAPFLAFSSRAPPPTAVIESFSIATFEDNTFRYFSCLCTWCVDILKMVKGTKGWFP